VRDTNLVPYIIVQYKIPYSEISFYKDDTIFEARYSSALVVKKGNVQIGGTSSRGKLILKDYSKTISPYEFFIGVLKKEISSGDYKIILNTWDLQSNRKWKWEKDITVTEIDNLDIVSIHWLSDPSYILSTEDNLRIEINVVDLERVGSRLSYYYKDVIGGIYFKSDTLLVDRERYVINIELPAYKFPENQYRLITKLREINGNEVRERSLMFEIREPFFTSKRYIKKVKQLIYIATPKEMEELINAQIEERKELWDKFWRERDPTDGVEVNEFSDEYFRRVDFAQEYFSTGLTEGWKSDRGKAYIILGPPDYIERHPFEIDRQAYEIWYYYDKGYRLVFEELYSLGEYYLINPPRGFN